MALITRDEVVAHEGVVGTSLDAMINALIGRVGPYFDRYCKRKLEATDYVEDYSGDGGPELFLRHFPINSIDSILISDTRDFASATALPASDYVIDGEAGIVRRVDSTGIDLLRRTSPGWPRGDYNIRVAYNGGFATIPEDLKEAAILWISQRIKRRGGVGVLSETIGEHTVTHESKGVASDVEAILNTYRSYPHLAPVRDAS